MTTRLADAWIGLLAVLLVAIFLPWWAALVALLPAALLVRRAAGPPNGGHR